MATPTGARHRDLEQRLRDLEAAVKAIAGAALRRKQLSVTEGDFVVSGGGDVVVQDGGTLRAEYESGRTAAEFGQLEETDGVPADAFGVRVLPDDDAPPGLSNALIEGFEAPSTGQVLRAFADGFATFRGGTGLVISCGPLGGGSDASVTLTDTGVLLGGATTVATRSTTGLAANVRFDGSGKLLEVTSSRRYKTDIEDAPDRADNLLDMRGRTWRDCGETAADTEARHVGYIAEELHDAGLTEYVEYDAEGLPHAIAYDRLTVPLVQLAQRQAGQIADLTARLDAAGL